MGASREWPSARGTASSSRSAAPSSAAARMRSAELGRADGASECEPTPAPLTLPTTAAVQQCVCADAAPTALLLTADRRIAVRRRRARAARARTCHVSADGEPSAAILRHFFWALAAARSTPRQWAHGVTLLGAARRGRCRFSCAPVGGDRRHVRDRGGGGALAERRCRRCASASRAWRRAARRARVTSFC